MNSMSDLIRIRGHAVWTPSLNASSVVVDAGAHRGEFSAEIYRRFACRCIAIEANPTLAKTLQVTSKGQLIHAALSSRDGTASFVFRDNPEAGSIISHAKDQGNSTMRVEMVSLQTVTQRANVARIDLLKLDIEGAEFPLLAETPDEVLAGISQITIEFHDFLPAYKGKGLFEEARARLEGLGFICCQMTFRTHGDVLFLNPKHIQLTAIQRVMVRWIGRWILKLKDKNWRVD